LTVTSSGRPGSRVNTAKLTCSIIRDQVRAYYRDVGKMPAKIDDLVRNNTRADKWNGPYFENGEVPVDPWGNPFEIVTLFDNAGQPEQVKVISFGPDGLPDSDDEIVLHTSL
jgi:general secretion pathway protein G